VKPAASDHPASVQLSPMAVRLTPELQEALAGMNDLATWAAWIREQKSGQSKDGDCPKCGVGRLRYFLPKAQYECDGKCGFVERTVAQ
jgi:hypothetical protein